MPIYVKIIIAVAVMIGFLALFIAIYWLNRRAKLPDDCPKDELPAGCSSCMLSCYKREDDFSLSTPTKSRNADLKSPSEENDLGGKE